MTDETLLQQVAKHFNIEAGMEPVDVYFRNTYGVTVTVYTDGSIRIDGVMHETGKATLNDIVKQLTQFPSTVYKLTDAAVDIQDSIYEMQKIVEKLQSRYQWSHLDEVHALLRLNLESVKNGAESIKILSSLLSLDKKEEKVKLPHYTECPEYNS